MPSAPRPRPQRTAPEVTASLAAPAEKTGPKAKATAENASAQATAADPMEDRPTHAPSGLPYVKVVATASDLIPTGDWANTTVGPVQFTAWLDPGNPDPLPQDQLDNLAKAANKLFETAQLDVVAVQRTLVLESLQQQAAGEGQ